MLVDRVRPTSVCLNAVVDAAAKAGKSSRALRWLLRMRRFPYVCEPDAFAAVAALDALARRGNAAGAERLLQ